MISDLPLLPSFCSNWTAYVTSHSLDSNLVVLAFEVVAVEKYLWDCNSKKGSLQCF